MFVSVIVPIYNVESFLSKCLDSLVNQDYENYEVIMVNDGSTDSSKDIAKEYEDKHNHFKLVDKPNGGLSDARNFGMSKAKGDAYAFVDSDDWVSVDYLKSMCEVMINNNCDVVCSDMEYVDEDNNHTFSSGGDFGCVIPLENPEIITINNSACNKLIKKKLFKNTIFPKGIWYEDLGCIPIIISKAKLVCKVDKPLYFYFQRSNSISRNSNKKIFDIYIALELLKKYFVENEQLGFEKEVDKLIVLHGADLTTNRISKFTDGNIASLLKENKEYLDKIYPDWYNDFSIRYMTFKKKVLIELLYRKQFKLLAYLLRKKD